MEHILQGGEFLLRLEPKVMPDRIDAPVNTSMEVFLQSDGFSAHTVMEIDVVELALFAAGLCRIYETLTGEARIEEPYGRHMFLAFTGDGKGHIAVSGALHKESENGADQSFEFLNYLDQTQLRQFCYELQETYRSYLP